MGYEISTYAGDKLYKLNATGDVCVGDEVCFERATFSGSFRKPTFDGFEKVEGEVVADSYGKQKQQHTFTIRLAAGQTTRIKGRNLYKNGVWRKKWSDEKKRQEILDEKHGRGAQARAERAERVKYNHHI